ncbi:MAG: hypothetical protein KF869_09500 [Phycisphaeraceae bacterium]|nr:hypothetical protein [Phycisphaeraceae bacterium]
MLTWRAHAKINLALAVGPAAPPRGYHPIASWFACVGLHDEVELTALGEGEPSAWRIEWAADAPRPTPIDWPIERDLAVRAHRAVESAVHRALPVRGVVRKRVPVGAGMGGGSADCAAAMMGLDRLFDLGLGAARLREIAGALGSDIAFFIDEECGPERAARPALVTGFGERIERLGRVPREQSHLVLFFPPFGCPTGPVYQAFDQLPPRPLREGDVRALAAGPGIDGARLFNDLAAPAAMVEPRLAEALARMRSAMREPGAHVHVTGSGSTMFALAQGEEHARAIVEKACSAAPEIVAITTMLV